MVRLVVGSSPIIRPFILKVLVYKPGLFFIFDDGESQTACDCVYRWIQSLFWIGGRWIEVLQMAGC